MNQRLADITVRQLVLTLVVIAVLAGAALLAIFVIAPKQRENDRIGRQARCVSTTPSADIVAQEACLHLR